VSPTGDVPHGQISHPEDAASAPSKSTTEREWSAIACRRLFLAALLLWRVRARARCSHRTWWRIRSTSAIPFQAGFFVSGQSGQATSSRNEAPSECFYGHLPRLLGGMILQPALASVALKRKPVLLLEMVVNSISPLRTHFGLVFSSLVCPETRSAAEGASLQSQSREHNGDPAREGGFGRYKGGPCRQSTSRSS
jgi:hypothetical protein